MGADGNIIIWNSKKVRQEWPDADEMFSRMPSYYKDMLDGVEYDHCYWGDNLYESWDDCNDWYPKCTAEEKDRIKKFTSWLWQNGTEWEVWT